MLLLELQQSLALQVRAQQRTQWGQVEDRGAPAPGESLMDLRQGFLGNMRAFLRVFVYDVQSG